MTRAALLLVTLALGGCALRSDVRRVEDQVADLKEATARRDAARGEQLAQIIRRQQELMDSLGAVTRAVRAVKGGVSNDLYNIEQQLYQLQQLTGQSQQRLTELRTQLESRAEQLQAAPAGGAAPAAAADTQRAAPTPSAEQMYEASLGQLRLGSASTARTGFRALLQAWPSSPQVPDALYYIGQSFETENTDSALAYFQRVPQSYPQSPRAAAALYHIGLIRERAGDKAAAREAYQRVVQQYPRSDEAALASDRMKALGH